MSVELNRAEELLNKIQSDPELLSKFSNITVDEAKGFVNELGYGDVTMEEIIKVLESDKTLSDSLLSNVAAGKVEALGCNIVPPYSF